jgi:hypothetical protein
MSRGTARKAKMLAAKYQLTREDFVTGTGVPPGHLDLLAGLFVAATSVDASLAQYALAG